MAAIGKVQHGLLTQVAVLFTYIQRAQGFGIDPVGHALADGSRGFHQGSDAARGVRCATMIVGALPEAACPAFYISGATLMKRELRLPDQRAVAEQPDRLLLGEEGSFAIDMRRVDHDGVVVYADGLGFLRIKGWVSVWAMRTPASTSTPPTRWNGAMRSPRKAMAISALNSGIRLMKMLAWLAPI